MIMRPYYLVLIAIIISYGASFLSISSNTKTIINLFSALLIIVSIPWSYKEYKKSKQDTNP